MQVHKRNRHSKAAANAPMNRAHKRAKLAALTVGPNRATRRAPLREAYALAQMQASQENAQVQDMVTPS